MKKLIIGTSLFFLIACSTKSPQFPWASLSLQEAQQVAGDKLIMLDFYTEW